MTILIKNGNVFIDGKFVKKDIIIENDIIKSIEDCIEENAEKVIDAEGKFVSPGFVDLHAHLRDPGQTYKEDIVTGTKSAAKGGFTTICAMPNTDPVVDNIATVEYIRRKAHDLGSCKVGVIGALTKKSEGKEIAEVATMLEGGIVAVSDDGRCVQNAKLKFNAMKYVSAFNIPVITHPEDYNLAGSGQINAGKMSTKLGLGGIPALAEEIMISRDIMFAEKTKCHLHIAHISTAKSIQMVREAKKNGLKITTEVTPHHLVLNEEVTATFDTNTKMKPPLRTENDRQACIKGLIDGTIDFVATDHAPHSDFEKEREYNIAPFGIVGFEHAFSILYDRLVDKGIISFETLIDKMAVAPAKFLNNDAGELKEGKTADIVILDLKKETLLTKDTMLSKSYNTPFIDTPMKGLVETTICDGKITWQA